MKFSAYSSAIAALSLTSLLAFATPFKRSPLTPSVHSPVSLNPPGGGTYPRIARVNGDLLAAFTVTTNGTHALTVTKSTDSGASWSSLSTIATGKGDLTNAYLIQLPSGDVVATYENHDYDANGKLTYFRLTASVSKDGGSSWTYLSEVEQRVKNGVNGLWEPFARLTADNTLQVYYSSENSASDQDILMRNSTDGGATWSRAATVAGGTTQGRDGMPSCTNFVGSSDGKTRLLCVFETTEGTGKFTVKRVLSFDDGATWSEREQVYVPTGTNNNAGAPFCTTTSDGTLVVSFMTDEDTSLHKWTSGADMKIVTSASTDPETWGDKTSVFPVQANWPSLFALSDGSILGCAEQSGKGAECSKITFS